MNDDIYELLQREFDMFLYKDGGVPSRLHLPLENNSPYCFKIAERDFQFSEKPVDAYPKGWRSICQNCLNIWKEEND